MRCQICSGLLQHIGILGNLAWFRCQNCGWEISDRIEETKDGFRTLPACEISDDECHGDTHQPVGHDLWFCEAH